jgi:predicted outer membrane protein
VPPLYILRKHLLWFIRKRVANIYKLLGTTKEEVITLRKKKNLTPEESKRVDEILKKAQEINQRLMKKLGIDTDEALIEKEVQKHKTKRFNIRESWLPL